MPYIIQHSHVIQAHCKQLEKVTQVLLKKLKPYQIQPEIKMAVTKFGVPIEAEIEKVNYFLTKPQSSKLFSKKFLPSAATSRISKKHQLSDAFTNQK